METALFSFPDVDFRKLNGSIVVDVVVFYTSPDVEQNVENAIISKFRDNLIFRTLYDRNHVWYRLVLPNLTVVEEVRAATSKIPGTKSVYVFPIADFLNLEGFQADKCESLKRRATSRKFCKITESVRVIFSGSDLLK